MNEIFAVTEHVSTTSLRPGDLLITSMRRDAWMSMVISIVYDITGHVTFCRLTQLFSHTSRVVTCDTQIHAKWFRLK